MPKVQVNRPRVHEVRMGQSTAGSPPVADTVYDVIDPVLHVCWRNSPDGSGHVQFMAEVDTAEVKSLVEKALEANSPVVALWFPTLERDEVNGTIRALRSARDKALGADE